MYMSYTRKPAWSLSNIPSDTIMIYRVTGELGLSDVLDQLQSDEEKVIELKRKASEMGITLDSIMVTEANKMIDRFRKD